MSEQDTAGLDPATATRAALERVTAYMRMAPVFYGTDDGGPSAALLDQIITAGGTYPLAYADVRVLLARVTDLEGENERLRDGLPAFVCPACGSETRARLTDAAQLEEVARLRLLYVERADAVQFVQRQREKAEARVAELEAQRAAVLVLCDEAERHAGTARFGYLNEDDIRAALTAAGDTGGTR